MKAISSGARIGAQIMHASRRQVGSHIMAAVRYDLSILDFSFFHNGCLGAAVLSVAGAGDGGVDRVLHGVGGRWVLFFNHGWHG